MKVKQRTVCQACRSRKIGCDGKTPSCTQCILRGVFCPGYQSDWTFVPQQNKKAPKPRNATTQPKQPKNAGRRKKEEPSASPESSTPVTTTTPSTDESSSQSDYSSPICPSPSLPLLHVVTLVVRSYVPDPDVQLLFPELAISQPRICGGWVEALPELIGVGGDDAALSAAVKCLGVAIMSGGPARRAPMSSAIEAYGSALRCLGTGLRKAENTFPKELVASVMCLLLAELILPTSLRSWVAHVQGFATIVQMSSPKLYSTGPAHRLFVGARPALIILAFLSRKSSFLNLEQWKTITFSREAPSPVQALLNHAVAIPGLLEKLDGMADAPKDEALRTAKACVESFESLLLKFASWENDFRATTHFPSHWMKDGEDGETAIWFRSITTANALTHYWAVQIVCRHNISKLKSEFPELACGEDLDLEQEQHENESVANAIRICQSIKYLMHDDMKLFGPTSVILPLRAAYDTFLAGGDKTKEQLLWCRRIIAQVYAKGFQFVTLFFDIFQVGQEAPA